MMPAHMKARSIDMSGSDVLCGNLPGGPRHDARGAQRLITWQLRLMEFRPLQHQTQDIEGAGAEYRRIDEEKGYERSTDRGGIDGRDRVARPQGAIDSVRLAAHFGGDPPGEHGDEACRRHDDRCDMQEPRSV